MKKYYPIKLDKGEFQLGAEKASPEINPTSNTFGLLPAGGGVTVKRLEVTENGTYTAPTGEAYSPVVVNVAGGGDFSIANVTVNVEGFSPGMPAYGIYDAVHIVNDELRAVLGIPLEPLGGYENPISGVLYNGETEWQINAGSDGIPISSVVGTGSIEVREIEGDYSITITGDGSITITYGSSPK